MTLEKRVKSLEYEIKILKNEIQRTLLDIQEQILVHYYPTLRTEELTPTEGTIQTIESIKAKKRQLEGRSEPSELTEDTELPEVKQVSLETLTKTEQETSSILEEETAAQTSQEDAARARLSALSGWVSSTAKKIGGERTARLIQGCTGKGVLDSELESPLLRITGLIAEDYAPRQVAVNDILSALLKLNELLDHEINIDQALSIIEETNLG